MTETAAADRFEERSIVLENIRAEIARRERVTLFSLIPLAAVMALIIPYVQIAITLQDADYYYILERPVLATYLRLAGAALFAGPLSVVIVYYIFKQFDEMVPGFIKMLIVGASFGMLMPLLTGIFTPLNLFVIGITGVSNVTGQGSVQQMLGDWVFSTPMFTFFFWSEWLGPGIVFGLIAGIMFWAIAKFTGPVERRDRAKYLYVASSLAAVAVLFLVTVWPFALFEFMFETFL